MDNKELNMQRHTASTNVATTGEVKNGFSVSLGNLYQLKRTCDGKLLYSFEKGVSKAIGIATSSKVKHGELIVCFDVFDKIVDGRYIIPKFIVDISAKEKSVIIETDSFTVTDKQPNKNLRKVNNFCICYRSRQTTPLPDLSTPQGRVDNEFKNKDYDNKKYKKGEHILATRRYNKHVYYIDNALYVGKYFDHHIVMFSDGLRHALLYRDMIFPIDNDLTEEFKELKKIYPKPGDKRYKYYY